MGDYNPANHQKYTRTDPVSRWHLNSVMGAVYQLVARTRPDTVLDAGCGEGFLAGYMAGQDPPFKITGVDLSLRAIGYARAHFAFAATFQTADLLELPFEDDSFDTVVCSEVLEHVSDYGRAMQEIKRVARSHVVVTVPNEPYFKWLNDFARAIRFSQDPGHVNFWTHSEFQALMRVHFCAPEFSQKHVIYQLALAAV